MNSAELPDPLTMSPAEVQAELQSYISTHGFRRPARSTIDESRPWLHGPPDYELADLVYFRGRSKLHAEGSLEDIVENAVKSWEMEASHLPLSAWKTVDHSVYKVCANGYKTYSGADAAAAGNYNWLMDGVDPELYDAKRETFESSHELFRNAFSAGFPWEVLEVFAGPPRICFSWRHWACFSGTYRERKGDGKRYDMYGWGVVTVNDQLKIQQIEIFYKPEPFLRALQGDIGHEQLAGGKSLVGDGCPFLARMGQGGAAPDS